MAIPNSLEEARINCHQVINLDILDDLTYEICISNEFGWFFITPSLCYKKLTILFSR